MMFSIVLNEMNEKYWELITCTITFIWFHCLPCLYAWCDINVSCFSLSSPLCRLIHGGQLLNGLAGPTIMSAGPLLSTTWFAPDQRATATAVASLVSYLGAACSFIVGPLLVPAPNDSTRAMVNRADVSTDTQMNHIRDRIQLVLYAGTNVLISYVAVMYAFIKLL